MSVTVGLINIGTGRNGAGRIRVETREEHQTHPFQTCGDAPVSGLDADEPMAAEDRQLAPFRGRVSVFMTLCLRVAESCFCARLTMGKYAQFCRGPVEANGRCRTGAREGGRETRKSLCLRLVSMDPLTVRKPLKSHLYSCACPVSGARRKQKPTNGSDL